MQKYQELEIWRKSVEVVKGVYELADKLPKVKKYGMISHMMHTALSIPVNITKSYGGKSSKELVDYLDAALESALSLQMYFILIRELLWTKDGHHELEFKLENLINHLHGEVKLIRSFMK